jgi:hypothetical protein
MAKPILNLADSEKLVVQAAATIYAAYIVANRVLVGQEDEFMARAIQEAFKIARRTDDAIQSDDEMG